MRDGQGTASSGPSSGGETQPTSASVPWAFYRIYRVDRYAVRERIDGVPTREEALEIISGEGKQGIRLLEEEMTEDWPPEWPTTAEVIDQIRTAALDPSLDYRQLLLRVSRDAERLPDSVEWSGVETYAKSLGRPVERVGTYYRIVVGGRTVHDVVSQQVFLEFRPMARSGGTYVSAHAGLLYRMDERADNLIERKTFVREPLLIRLLREPEVKSALDQHPIVKSIVMDDLPTRFASAESPDYGYQFKILLGDEVGGGIKWTFCCEAPSECYDHQHPLPTDLIGKFSP